MERTQEVFLVPATLCVQVQCKTSEGRRWGGCPDHPVIHIIPCCLGQGLAKCVFECVHVCVHACDVLFAHSTSFHSSSSFENNWQGQTQKRKSHPWLLKAISLLLSNFDSLDPTGRGRWLPTVEPGSVRGLCLFKGRFFPIAVAKCLLMRELLGLCKLRVWFRPLLYEKCHKKNLFLKLALYK